ncbi:MAG: hypothetical protein U0414_36470 [Polyangiaceae bacterium]
MSGLSALDVHEIVRCMEATECGAILVPPRILRRVIKLHRRIAGVGFDVPHPHVYVIPKDQLLGIADEEELAHKADALGESVILLPVPEVDPTADRTDAIISLWRSALHGSIHRDLEGRITRGELSDAEIRARVHVIGQTEFDEVRFVLAQDELILPPEDEASIFVEFAATYLELRVFAPEALHDTFPALTDLSRVDALLLRDFDLDKLLAACRPANAPPQEEISARLHKAPEVVATPKPRKAPTLDPAAVSKPASRARAQGNVVRSILLLARAHSNEKPVYAEMCEWMKRVSEALSWSGAPTEEWATTLLPIIALAPATHRLPWNRAARMLYDIQKVCIDAERELYTLSVVEWALSFGKLPVKRALPAQRRVRIVKHLRAALAKLPAVDLDVTERNAIARLLRTWIHRAEGNVRDAFSGVIEATLKEVGLFADSAPERVSMKKLVGELIDKVIELGYISIGNLRDAISKSALKMSNLELDELWKGDALLLADGLLARRLDGVYLKGEGYLRGLQKLSSIFFGTTIGRYLSLYVLLPAVFGYVVLEGLQHTIGVGIDWIGGVKHVEGEPEHHLVEFTTPITVPVVSAFAFLMIHSKLARATVLELLGGLWLVLRFLLFTVPSWILHLWWMQKILKSAPFVFFKKYVFKPAVFATIAFLSTHWVIQNFWLQLGITIATFLVMNAAINSRIGMMLEEAAVDWLTHWWGQLKRRLLPGLFALIVRVFARLLEIVDRFIYSVDELLRFRQGQSSVAYAVKAFLGVIWFFVTYFIRVYIALLFEPWVNPLKHFPTVTVAGKMLIPYTVAWTNGLSGLLKPILGPWVGNTFAGITVFLAPGFFGFVVWELKENWKLYKMNRPKTVDAVIIGHHGETMTRFLKPGLHSGTVPKLFAKIRHAAWKRDPSLIKHKEALHHLEESIRTFAEREMVPLLAECQAWTGGPLHVGRIDVASNRIRIELWCAKIASEPLRISFEEQSGWLIAGLQTQGFVRELREEQRVLFENVLAGLYKLAGVEIVREQLTASIGTLPYDIAEQGLVVWPDRSYRTSVVYDLRTRSQILKTTLRVGLGALPSTLKKKDVFFSEETITWNAWVEAWRPGVVAPRLVTGPSLFGANLPPDFAPMSVTRPMPPPGTGAPVIARAPTTPSLPSDDARTIQNPENRHD